MRKAGVPDKRCQANERALACVRDGTSWQGPASWFRGKARRARTGLPVHERAPSPLYPRTMAASSRFRPRAIRLAERPSALATADADLTCRTRTIHAGSHGWRGPLTPGRWRLCWTEADCPADASGRDCRPQQAQKRADHDAASDKPSSASDLSAATSGPSWPNKLGGQYHRPADISPLSRHPCIRSSSAAN